MDDESRNSESEQIQRLLTIIIDLRAGLEQLSMAIDEKLQKERDHGQQS